MKDIKGLEYVNKNSNYVSIDRDRIEPFIKDITNWNYTYWLYKEKIDLNEKEFIISSFICQSMNFCFWGSKDWKVEFRGNTYMGSEALFYSVLKGINMCPNFLDLENLKKINKPKFQQFLYSNGNLPKLFSKRFKLFKETINIICQKKDSFFEELFSARTDEEIVEYIIKNFKHFDDKSKFMGKTIHFNKRAILLTNDLFRMSKTIRNNIKSINNLTGGADYSVPRVLQEKGILKYNDELLEIIKKEKRIKHNNQMEIEIRANTLLALELIKERIYIKKNINIETIELDNIIWNSRNNTKTPPHHTKTIFY